MDAAGCEHSFGHGRHGLFDGLQGNSFSEFFADESIAAVSAVAGGDEITESGESEEGFCFSSEGCTETYHFAEPASDECGFGIVAEAEAIADTSGDGDHVFQGTAKFDAEEIRIGIDSQKFRGHECLNLLGGTGVCGGGDDTGGFSLDNFFSMAGTAEGDYGLGGEEFPEHSTGTLQGRVLDAFDGTDECGLCRDAGGEAGESVTKSAHGNAEQDDIGIFQGKRPITGNLDGFREADVGQQSIIAAGELDLASVVGIAGPEANPVAGAL